jgi:hypothetical protein
MAELVINSGHTETVTLGGIYSSAKSYLYRLVNRKISTSELVFLALTLTFLQILDGIMTGIGVITFGPDIEANLFIRGLILSFGVVPALIIVKTFALMVIIALCSMVHRVTWLACALKCIIVLYIFAAIIPWTMILAFNPA